MAEMTMLKAIRETLRSEMEKDEDLFIVGEDVGPYGGEQGVTGDLWQQFGDARVRDAPIAEESIIGLGLGAAMTGGRAVSEIPFGDFLGVCMDQVLNEVSKFRYMSAGQFKKIGLVIRTTMGGYMSAAEQHSESLASWYVHIPGIKVVIPSTPADAMGLLRSAMRDGNPVIVFEHKQLYAVKGEVPDEDDYTVPLGKANLMQEGDDCTVIATGLQVYKAQEAAEKLADDGIEIDLIDPRTLDPLDEETILNSVKKTGRLVVVHETWQNGGYGAEIVSRIADKGIYYLLGPIKRVGAKHTPIPFSPVLENFILPQTEDIVNAVKETME